MLAVVMMKTVVMTTCVTPASIEEPHVWRVEGESEGEGEGEGER